MLLCNQLYKNEIFWLHITLTFSIDNNKYKMFV